MVKLATEQRVYSEFLTNGAVAWFSAGVIAPLFAEKLGTKEAIASTFSVFSCILFLKLASFFSKEDR